MIDRALALRPDSPDLLALLASLDGRDPDTQVRARDRWLRALQLAPTRADYALGLAAALIALGDQVAARNLLGPLAGAHPDESVRTRARELLARSAQADLDAEGVSLPPITCGPRPSHEKVLVTWRADKQTGTDGDLVAVEFLPQEPR